MKIKQKALNANLACQTMYIIVWTHLSKVLSTRNKLRNCLNTCKELIIQVSSVLQIPSSPANTAVCNTIYKPRCKQHCEQLLTSCAEGSSSMPGYTVCFHSMPFLFLSHSVVHNRCQYYQLIYAVTNKMSVQPNSAIYKEMLIQCQPKCFCPLLLNLESAQYALSQGKS